MIRQYTDATEEAFKNAVSILVKQGFWNGEYDPSHVLYDAMR
jgi:hypothetical protein